MHLGWPQLIYIALMFLATGGALAKHGESKGTHNFGVALIADAITLSLLWWGGFFS